MALSTPWLVDVQQQLVACRAIDGWGIGGSCLLRRHGVVSQHRDIDIVCSASTFVLLHQAFARQGWQLLPPLPLGPLQSDHFARWRTPDGQIIELMAGINVVQQGIERRWCFSPSTVEWMHELPWMRLADWLTLYQLFERPQRVAQLQRHIAQNASALVNSK